MNPSELDLLRLDIEHQLKTPNEFDWDYLLETVKEAKLAADREDRNMTTECRLEKLVGDFVGCGEKEYD